MGARNISRIILPFIAVTALVAPACGGDDSASDTTATLDSVAVETSVAATVATSTTVNLPTPEKLTATKVMSARKPMALVERSVDDPFVYIVERDGTVSRLGYDGTKIAESLNIVGRTKASVEGGLLGLTFLQVDSSWYAYVNYTDRAIENTLIDEYLLDTNGDFIADSRRTVLTFEQPYPNHNGGDLKIGPDNMLYIASGDGGDGGDPKRYAMKTDNLLGKILRIDPAPTATTRNADTYNIPSDNPYVGFVDAKGNPARGEIWSIGLRNPWRIDIDRTGTMWIADVGQNKWEEVSMSVPTGNDLVGGRGSNFGWSAFEATHVMNPEMSAEEHVPPVYEYSHTDGGCAVSGGVHVRDTVIASLRNWYLYSDSCHGKIGGIKVQDGSVVEERFFTEELGSIVSVNQTSRGIFALAYGGAIYQITE